MSREYTSRTEGRIPKADVESISRWVLEAYPDWRRWRRSWRSLLPVMVCYGSAGELWSEFGIDPDELLSDGEHAGESFVRAVLKYYRDGLYGMSRRPAGGRTGGYELSPGDLVVRLMYEEGLLASRRVFRGTGTAEDYKLIDRCGFTLPLRHTLAKREAAIEQSRGRTLNARPKMPFPLPEDD